MAASARADGEPAEQSAGRPGCAGTSAGCPEHEERGAERQSPAATASSAAGIECGAAGEQAAESESEWKWKSAKPAAGRGTGSAESAAVKRPAESAGRADPTVDSRRRISAAGPAVGSAAGDSVREHESASAAASIAGEQQPPAESECGQSDSCSGQRVGKQPDRAEIRTLVGRSGDSGRSRGNRRPRSAESRL